jgi:hypothetical protein
MAKRTSSAWFRWSLSEHHLNQKAMDAAHITQRDIQTLRSSPSPDLVSRLHSAYTKTQYSKLTRAGVSREEAWRISRGASPSQVASTVKDFRSYVDEMIIRKGGTTSMRGWERARKAIRKAMRRSKYSVDRWAEFANFYAKNPFAKFKFGKEALGPSTPPPPPVHVSPVTGEPMPLSAAAAATPRLRSETKAGTPVRPRTGGRKAPAKPAPRPARPSRPSRPAKPAPRPARPARPSRPAPRKPAPRPTARPARKAPAKPARPAAPRRPVKTPSRRAPARQRAARHVPQAPRRSTHAHRSMPKVRQASARRAGQRKATLRVSRPQVAVQASKSTRGASSHRRR